MLPDPGAAVAAPPSASAAVPWWRRSAWAPCLASGVLCAVLLVAVLQLYGADLRIPLNYRGDSTIFVVRVKGLLQGDWVWSNSRLGMPFGADLRDFPMNITFDSLGLWLLGVLLKTPGLVLNLYWLLAMVTTAGLATYGLIRLHVDRWIAAGTGVLFALQPYGFYRGISHLHSLYYLVPLLAAGAIELALGRWSTAGEGGAGKSPWRRIPAYLWFGCLAMGLSYLYSAFFACFVLLVATLLACAVRRRLREALPGVALIALISVTAAADLSPTLVHWARDGTNPAMDFKYPGEAEIYGLKIRLMLTPIPDHPLALFRRVDQRLRAGGFPYDTENESARLGTAGSVGFLALLGLALFACVRSRPHRGETERILGVAAALCVACVLLATVGGFGALFNGLVVPDIRCYNRIAPFIAFFSLLALALLLTGAHNRWARRGTANTVFRVLFPLFIVLAVYDQAPTVRWLPHAARERIYRADADYVRQIENVLPYNSMIFQLPFMDFPVEHLVGRMFNNDEGRPYVHSDKYRWTWAAVSGTTSAEWNRQAAALPAPEMLHKLVHRGFAGLWVDLFGYDASGSPEAQITQAAGVPPLRSADGRYLFYDLRPCAAKWKAAEAGATRAQLRAQHPVDMTFERGFYDEQRQGERVWHWARKRGRLVLINPLVEPRTVQLSLTLETGVDRPERLRIEAAGDPEQVLVERERNYSRTLTLPPGAPVAVSFSCGGCRSVAMPADPRERFFAVGVRVSDP